MTHSAQIIGRLLQSDCASMTFACLDGQYATPTLGALIRMAGSAGRQVYALIGGVSYPEDALAMPYMTPNLAQGVIDEAVQRSGGPRINARFVGYTAGSRIVHGLPAHPPVALTEIHLCDAVELAEFTAAGTGYLRLLVPPESGSLPVDAVALHMANAYAAHQAVGPPEGWLRGALRELVRLLLADLPALRRAIYAIDDQLIMMREEME